MCLFCGSFATDGQSIFEVVLALAVTSVITQGVKATQFATFIGGAVVVVVGVFVVVVAIHVQCGFG